MKPFVLYCKSYSTDLRRVVRLADSIKRYNQENIPFYISVTRNELELFNRHLKDFNITLIADEEIISASPRFNSKIFNNLPGNIQQQIIKSEFWRLNISSAYLCLDSDGFFIRPFSSSDFITPEGIPYTIIDEAHDVLEAALHQGRHRILDAFKREADEVQKFLGRNGKRYSFGPFPVVWHRAVWESLDKNYLEVNNIGFTDAIEQAPSESRWYGEALLSFRAIPLIPCQALFKVYHYAWQFDFDRRNRIQTEQLARIYCGVIYQSAWEREMDWPNEGGKLFSRLGRRLRRGLGRI